MVWIDVHKMLLMRKWRDQNVEMSRSTLADVLLCACTYSYTRIQNTRGKSYGLKSEINNNIMILYTDGTILITIHLKNVCMYITYQIG